MRTGPRYRSSQSSASLISSGIWSGFGKCPERRARFAREAKAIAGLNHRHICALHDVGREGDVDFLVMEYVDGTRLASTYPVAKALEYAIQIVDALRASHQNGMIHRDLKPANVMVTPEGQVKVLDFGLSKHLAAPAAPRSGERELLPLSWDFTRVEWRARQDSNLRPSA